MHEDQEGKSCHPAEKHQPETQEIAEELFVVDAKGLKQHDRDQCEEQQKFGVVSAGDRVMGVDKQQYKAREYSCKAVNNAGQCNKMLHKP